MNTENNGYIILTPTELKIIGMECERIGLWNARMIINKTEDKMKNCIEYVDTIIANGGLPPEEE